MTPPLARWQRGGVDDDDLPGWVLADFGLELTALTLEHSGADSRASLWRAAGADGATYAVKLSGGGTAAGMIVTANLAAQGVAGLPAPVRTRGGLLWSDRVGRRLSVVPWVSDIQALDARMGMPQWRAFGHLLRSVHDCPVTPDLADALPRDDYQYRQARAELDAVRAHSLSPADACARRVVQLLDCEAVPRLLERTDALAVAARSRPAPTVVCHSDPHLGNVLVGQSDHVWLIDWDDAMLSAPERDLMFAVDGLPEFAPVTADDQSQFWRGYGEVTVDAERLAYFRCMRAMEDLFGWGARAMDPVGVSETERATALSIVENVLQPGMFIDLALSPVRVVEPAHLG
jgi:spectinomycin phosphotransferase